MEKHKVFISRYHADEEEVNKFIEYFCDEKGVFIKKIVGDDYDTTINSEDPDYIMRKIGDETYKRKYVDWEIASTLRNDPNNKRSGLLGIYLPGKSDSEVPYRLQDNVDCGYAKVYSYPTGKPETLEKWIDEAYDKRNDPNYEPDNTRELFKRNRS